MLKYADYLVNTPTAQAPGMVANNGGGFAYQVDSWTALKRFLVLGSEGGTYYVSERKLTVDNAKAVVACIESDPAKAVAEIVRVSTEGLAPKQGPAIFALALVCASPDPTTRALGYRAVGSVCRTGTHLFTFVDSVDKLRGWSRGLNRAVANWYLDKTTDKLGYQLLKYKQREGWSHRDVLRLCHAKPKGEAQAALLGYAAGKVAAPHPMLPAQVNNLHVLHHTEKHLLDVPAIVRHNRFTHEMLPSECLKNYEVWDALLHDMPIGAVVRNLGRMTANGLFTKAAAVAYVSALLSDGEVLKKARLHPVALLNALRVYAKGRGDKGSLSWTPNNDIISALDRAFYASFKTVEPTGKRFLLAMDVSPSMWGAAVAGTGLTCAEGAVAMALVTKAVEPACTAYLFAGQGVEVNFKDGATLDQIQRDLRAGSAHWSATDCSLPILAAAKHRRQVDVFVVYTDSETNANRISPCEALRQYRQQTGIDAKLIVVGMASNGFTIADPKDKGMLDVVGFSTDVPQVIDQFVRG